MFRIVVPVGQLDPAVDAELEQLDGVNVLLDEVGIDRLGVAAVGMDGESALLPASRGRASHTSGQLLALSFWPSSTRSSRQYRLR